MSDEKGLNAEVKRLLIDVAELTKRKKELAEVEIPEMLQEANKPIVEAQQKAEKIIADAKTEAEKVKVKILQETQMHNEKARKIEREANALLIAVRTKNYESASIREAADKAWVDFNAYKYAEETNISQLKKEADQLMNSALVLKAEQNTRVITINGRDSVVIKKEEDCKKSKEELEVRMKQVQDKIEELRAVESVHLEEKAEVATLKSENEDILASIRAEKEEVRIATIANQKILAEAKKTKEEVEKTKQENSNQLASIARDTASVEEKTRTLHEKERMDMLYARELDKKINVLKKLRAEDNESPGA